MKPDLYQQITDQIIRALEHGTRPWHQPWNAGHAAGRITRPLRAGGIPYQGINVLMLWAAAVEKGYATPFWFTFKQALDLGAHVRKGEKGSLVVYADRITRTETDAATGEESETSIPFLKGYTVFNAEQVEGLPESYYARPVPRLDTVARIDAPSGSSPPSVPISSMVETAPAMSSPATRCGCWSLKPSAMPRAITQPSAMKPCTGRSTPRASTGSLAASASAMRDTPWKSWWRNSARLFFAAIFN